MSDKIVSLYEFSQNVDLRRYWGLHINAVLCKITSEVIVTSNGLVSTKSYQFLAPNLNRRSEHDSRLM